MVQQPGLPLESYDAVLENRSSRNEPLSTPIGLSEDPMPHDHNPVPEGGHGALHGFLVICDKSIYLSHLPTFSPPHDYQVVLRASLAKNGDDPTAIYLADREKTSATVYTFKPDLMFLMPELVSTDPHSPAIRMFKGTLFRGNFF